MKHRAPTAILIALLLGGPGCYYELDEVPFTLDQSVPPPPDLAEVVDGSYDGPLCPNGTPPVHSGELSEGPIDRWGAEPIAPLVAEPATAMVSLDADRVAAGQASLRFETTNAQAGLFYPKDRAASFDLSPYLYFSFSITADNASPTNDPGWRGAQPHFLVVTSKDDYYEYVPDENWLSRSPGAFTKVTVPLAGGYGWQRNTQGTPDLTRVRYFALLFSTWGAGFTVWVDDLRLGPAAFYDCQP